MVSPQQRISYQTSGDEIETLQEVVVDGVEDIRILYVVELGVGIVLGEGLWWSLVESVESSTTGFVT